MNGRTLSRRAATAVAITATAVLGATNTAAAEPKTPVDTGIEQLTLAAGTDQATLDAVATVTKSAQLVAAANLTNIAFTPFGYTAPTIGCGTNLPFTMTAASASPGVVNGPELGISGPPGTLRFQAAPAHSGMPLASGLSVAWLNVGNGRSGISPLADLTEYSLPALATTVDSGPGTVVASLWGSIDYPAARCLVLPTVGLFTVAELPKTDADAKADTGSGGGSGDAGAAAPSAPAVDPAAPAAPVAPAAN